MIAKTHERCRASNVRVTRATPDEASILSNLIELCVYEFSEFLNLDLGADGRFGYKHLALYWSEPNRNAFLVRIDGKLAGFVFVKRGSEISTNPDVWDLAEFFVVRKYRRRGIGTDIANQVWRLFPGVWEVRVMDWNDSAHDFWERAIRVFTGEAIQSVPIEKSGKRWRVFSFS